MTRRKRIWRFICCLFDAHRLRYDLRCNWHECVDCGERRLTDAEFEHVVRRSGR